MKKVLPLALLTLLVFMIPNVKADTSITLQLTPEPEFTQVWAYETYVVNVSLVGFNIADIDLTEFTGISSGLVYEVTVTWRGYGRYKYGNYSVGYTINPPYLDEKDIKISTEASSVAFNLTIEKDSYEYGLKPFEFIDVKVSVKVRILMSDGTYGPQILTKSQTYALIDETKVDYLNGRYSEMQEEIHKTISVSGLKSFNRDRFQNIIDTMNVSLSIGDYVEAFDIWDDYNEDDRVDMINGLVRASNIQYSELESFQSLEEQLQETEDRLTIAQLEYTQLENTYNALSSTYRKVNSDLEISRRNFSTAITAVFLTAIVFYFLGRRGINREEAERLDEPDIY